jgi:hypothetical protein
MIMEITVCWDMVACTWVDSQWSVQLHNTTSYNILDFDRDDVLPAISIVMRWSKCTVVSLKCLHEVFDFHLCNYSISEAHF